MTAVERITAALAERETMLDAATAGPWILGGEHSMSSGHVWTDQVGYQASVGFSVGEGDDADLDAALIVAVVNQQRALIAHAREVLDLATAMIEGDHPVTGHALRASLLDAWCPS